MKANFFQSQKGVASIEFMMLLPFFIVMIVFITDVSLFMRHRQQVQSAAFSSVNVLANRTQYFNKTNADKLTSAELQQQTDQLQQMVELQLGINGSSAVGITTRAIYFQSGLQQVKQATAGPACASPDAGWDSAAITNRDKVAYYTVWLCHSKPWTWQSEGFFGLAMRQIHGREILGRAVAAQR